jgi:protein required for attachment to host cells
VGRYLEQQNYEKKFDQIAIAAEPKMMGRIRNELDRKLSDRVDWVSKDLARLDQFQIAAEFGINLRIAQ